MKKFLSLLLTLALALSLAACGGKDAGTTAPPPAESNGDSGQTEAPPPAEDVTITVAALASGYEEAYPGMWQEVCDAFTEATGVKVNLICDKNLEDVIGPSMQGGDFPDVIHLATGREKGLTEQFIKDRNIAELTDVLSMTVPGESVKVSDKIVGGFTDTSVTNPYGDGVTYLAPMFYSPCGLFYNAGLFEEKGWSVPATWDEMWELAEKAQANDQDFTQNQQLVMDNKALFMPNGTWIVGEMAEAPRAEGFKWGMTALPAAKAGGNGASYCWLEQAWIPAAAPNLDAAKQFVAFLYSDAACAIFAKGGAVQPVPGLTDNLEGDNKLFYSIYDNGADAAMGNFAAYNAVAGLGTVREVFLDPVNGLVNGSVTVDQWISDVKAASDQMRANIMG
nr:extracellular solute-binding protein [uncultured Oscillibacter sp.]